MAKKPISWIIDEVFRVSTLPKESRLSDASSEIYLVFKHAQMGQPYNNFIKAECERYLSHFSNYNEKEAEELYLGILAKLAETRVPLELLFTDKVLIRRVGTSGESHFEVSYGLNKLILETVDSTGSYQTRLLLVDLFLDLIVNQTRPVQVNISGKSTEIFCLTKVDEVENKVYILPANGFEFFVK